MSSLEHQNKAVSELGYDARAVANYVLDRGDQLGIGISNMAVNKIIYFAHATFLTTLQKSLVVQQFEAWQYGPIIQDLYHAFKKFGDTPITERAKRLDRATAKYVLCEYSFAEEDFLCLANVVDFHIRIPALELSDLSHATGGAWYKVWHHEGKSNPGMLISNELIHRYCITTARN
jgi:uncharacterized phage-associated protein